MRSGGKHILHLFAQQRRAERQAARKALGRGDDIGLHAVVHIAVQLSAAAIADLHLVADEKQIILFAQFRRALDIRLVQRHDAALALHDLHHDGGAFVGLDQLLKVSQIVRLGIDEALGQGSKIVVEDILTGRGQGGDRAAMEAVFQGDDGGIVLTLFLLRPLPGGLDGALVRLRAGIAEEDLLHAGLFAEHLRKLYAWLRIIEIRNMLERAELLGDGGHPFLVRHAEDINGNAGRQLDIFLARIVPDERTLALYNCHGEARVGVRNIGLVKLLCIHVRSSYLVNIVPMPSFVSISIRMACGTRPSMMNTRFTPHSMALRQHSAFGIMPP